MKSTDLCDCGTRKYFHKKSEEKFGKSKKKHYLCIEERIKVHTAIY